MPVAGPENRTTEPPRINAKTGGGNKAQVDDYGHFGLRAVKMLILPATYLLGHIRKSFQSLFRTLKSFMVSDVASGKVVIKDTTLSVSMVHFRSIMSKLYEITDYESDERPYYRPPLHQYLMKKEDIDLEELGDFFGELYEKLLVVRKDLDTLREFVVAQAVSREALGKLTEENKRIMNTILDMTEDNCHPAFTELMGILEKRDYMNRNDLDHLDTILKRWELMGHNARLRKYTEAPDMDAFIRLFASAPDDFFETLE